MPDTFLYNAFISYSSTDLPWAEKLETDLAAAGLKPFRDKSQGRLKGGEEWESQLVARLEESQHLVLLMSKASALSDWVTEERTRFKIMIDPRGTGALVANRRILVICLDQNPPPTLAKFHAYTQIMSAGEDPLKIAAAWKQITADIVETLVDKSNYVNVPVVTFAMTKSIIANSGPNTIEVPPLVPPMTVDQFLQTHSIDSQAELQARYGARPADWKPFDEKTVREIFEAMLTDPQGINVRITELQGPKEVRWTWPDLMNAGFDQFQAQIKQLRGQPLLVIVDPLSLCNGHVNTRFNQIQSWLQNREAAVIIMPPFRPQPPFALLHQWLRVRTAPLLDFYYDPPPSPNQTFTGHVVSATEEYDILRVVKNALCSSDRVIPARVTPSSPMIRQ